MHPVVRGADSDGACHAGTPRLAQPATSAKPKAHARGPCAGLHAGAGPFRGSERVTPAMVPDLGGPDQRAP